MDGDVCPLVDVFDVNIDVGGVDVNIDVNVDVEADVDVDAGGDVVIDIVVCCS